MAFNSIDAKAAAASIGEDGKAIYIDVRTVAEFCAGRPKGRALNIPFVFYHPKTEAEHDNDAFELVVTHHVEKTQTLVIGGDAGPRAARAANALAAMGFSDLAVMEGGIDSWRDAELPVTGDNREGVSYVSLLTPARRAKPADD